MKKRMTLFVIVLILALSVLISAFSFSNLFRFTGDAVDDWELTDPSGICMGISSSFLGGFVPSLDCINYSSKSSCDSSLSCGWNPHFYDYGGDAINVSKGWNLMWDFYYPGQISSGTISPSDIKAVYSLDLLNKKYYEIFPHYNSTYEQDLVSSYSVAGYIGIEGTLSWVYVNKSGSFKFRIPLSDTTIQPYNFGSTLPTSHLIKGWNFVGISPAMFFTSSSLSPDAGFNIPLDSYFTLNNIAGNCNITSAHFFEGGPEGGWTNVSVSDPINGSRLMQAIAINVTHDCILGQTEGNIICESDGAINYKVKGTVSLIDSLSGQIIQSQSDSCQTFHQLSQWFSSAQQWSGSSLALVKKYCSFDSNGNVEIMNYTVYPGPNCPNGCVNGACKESASCTTSSDCYDWGGSTAVCVSGQCYDTGAVPSPSCMTNADCSGTSYNSYCVEGHCEGTGFIGCIRDTDCDVNQTCLNGKCSNTNFLPSPSTSCTSNSNCSSSQICSGGTCYEKGSNICLNNADCYALGYPTAVCVGGQCMGTGALVCNQTQTSCGTVCCNDNQICAGGYCYDTGGLGKCSTSADCSSGQICSGGQCYSTGAILPSPLCRSDSDCSIGYCFVTPMNVFAQCVNNVTNVICDSDQTLCGTNTCCSSGQYCVVDYSSGVGMGQCEGTGALCSNGQPYCGTQCCIGTQVCATMSDGSKMCMGTGAL